MKRLCLLRGLFCTGFLAASVLFYACAAYPYEIELEPITVSIQPVQGDYTTPTKNTTRISPDQEHAFSVEAAIDTVTGIDVSKRGIFNIQSDISIRGATFEQTTISVNNIILNDPQTAHHSLDLAIPQAAIDNIEIVKGQSARTWAQSNIGGAINISTKRPVKTESDASLLYGTDNTRMASIYASSSQDKAGMNIAFEESASDGFRPGTDFRQFSASSSGLLRIGEKASNYFFLGYGEKEFGAANFYAPYNSREWTDTLFLNWQAMIEAGRFKIKPGLYYRKHHDKFLLDTTRPDFYLNHHKTGIKGICMDSSLDFGLYGMAQGFIDINKQSIKSTNLGKASRGRHSYSLIWKNHTNFYFGYEMSLRVDDYSKYSTEVLPQAGAYLRPVKWLLLRSSVSKSARPPSYTDLFYEDPANKGNKDLSPERALSYELGGDFVFGENDIFNLSLTFFRRDADNLIDWVKDSDSDMFFQARNLTRVKTEGLEVDLRADIMKWLKLKAGYSYVDSDIKRTGNYISKYALNHPDHKIAAGADIVLPFGTQNINMVYKNKKHYNSYFLMGCNFSYSLNKYAGVFLTIENLLNTTYWDIRDNTLPGRQIMAGLKARF
jgi:vitamin B12 transporter